FAPPGSMVRIGVDVRGRACRITISVDGPGIDDGQLENVFNRYVSIRPAPRDGDGNGAPHFGIGLFVVRRNVELMGGRVHLANRPGGGLDAVVELALST